MAKPRDIRELTKQERKEFLDSFDIVMTDCDGVLWLTDTPITGALDTLKMFQYLGKKIVFVSNNTSHSVESYVRKLLRMGYDATPDQIIIPSWSLAWYLKQIGFSGKAMAIATQSFIQVLLDNGIHIITAPNCIEEDTTSARELLSNEPDVDAVIVDFDLNLNYVKMVQVGTLLERRDVLFLVGTRDYKIPVTETRMIMGPGAFVDLLINFTGRTPIEYAKPSIILKDYVCERFEISNPERCMFVGDSLATDMKFAELCGFTKLLVNSGINQTNSLHHDSVIPDYYLPNLGMMPEFKNI